MTIYKFAGFWRRFIAFSIDNTIIIIIFSVLSIIAATAYVLGAISSNSDAWIVDLTDPTSSLSIMFISCTLYFVTILFYFTYFHGTTGRTPGKMLLGLQVVSADATMITFGTAFSPDGRLFYLVYISSWLYLGCI